LTDGAGIGQVYIDDSGDATGRHFTHSTLAAVPHFGGAGFQVTSNISGTLINYTRFGISTFQLAAGTGNDTIDVLATSGYVNGFGAVTTSTFFGDAGNDTFNITGDGLAGDNDFQGNGGNDTFNLNIAASIGASNADPIV